MRVVYGALLQLTSEFEGPAVEARCISQLDTGRQECLKQAHRSFNGQFTAYDAPVENIGDFDGHQMGRNRYGSLVCPQSRERACGVRVILLEKPFDGQARVNDHRSVQGCDLAVLACRMNSVESPGSLTLPNVALLNAASLSRAS